MEADPSQFTDACKSCTARCCKGLAVVLTIPEALRLAKDLPHPPAEFLEFSSQIDSRETPHYPLLAMCGRELKEYFILLKRTEKTECSFLRDGLGCGIYSIRPHVCRLYPFDLEGKNVKKRVLCPVKFRKGAEMEEVARQVQQDLLEHGIMARRWTLMFGGDGLPDMENFWEYFGKGGVPRQKGAPK